MDENTQTSVAKKQAMISISELFSKSFAIYKTIFWQIIGMSLVTILGAIPFGVIMLLYALITQGSTMALIFNIILGILSLMAVVFWVIVSIISQLGVYILVKHNNPELKVVEAFKLARKDAWQFLALLY